MQQPELHNTQFLSRFHELDNDIKRNEDVEGKYSQQENYVNILKRNKREQLATLSTLHQAEYASYH
jgi:hypothetical protein